MGYQPRLPTADRPQVREDRWSSRVRKPRSPSNSKPSGKTSVWNPASAPVELELLPPPTPIHEHALRKRQMRADRVGRVQILSMAVYGGDGCIYRVQSSRYLEGLQCVGPVFRRRQ